jgi:hypothetical protein
MIAQFQSSALQTKLEARTNAGGQNPPPPPSEVRRAITPIFVAFTLQSRYIYRVPQSMSPRRNCGIGTLPSPLSPASVPGAPPPGTKEGGGLTHWREGGGGGESQFLRLEKKLSTLPTLCFICLSSARKMLFQSICGHFYLVRNHEKRKAL